MLAGDGCEVADGPLRRSAGTHRQGMGGASGADAPAGVALQARRRGAQVRLQLGGGADPRGVKFGFGERPVQSAIWPHYELRKRWNRVKLEVAPWWAECSKEAYSNGIADAVNALKDWHASKTGGRKGS